MVLTKDELIATLRSEVRLLTHLLSKVEPDMLAYRPTPHQRNLLELLQYLSIMPPIHLRATLADSFDGEAWSKSWNAEEAIARTLSLDEIREAIGRHNLLFDELLGPCTDEQLRTPIEMFGGVASRGSMIVSLVLTHYSAYRMQLFLYLKSCGREELNTMNLWVGVDRAL